MSENQRDIIERFKIKNEEGLKRCSAIFFTEPTTSARNTES
ncbi:MAG: hypothetical protein QW484_02570 [Candidatus Pacearchaeota archaeon]